MTKLYSLFARTTTDTEVKTVLENQIIQMEGYNYDRYVVHKITQDQYGYHYHLINLHTLDMQQSEIIKPLSQQFGIGMYYDENNIQFMNSEDVAELYEKAKEKQESEQQQVEQEKERRKAVKEIGRRWLKENLPLDAKAIIIARLKVDKSDLQTDYYASKTVRTVILGFSKHKRDLFSEMRKYASNFKETAYLATYNERYENREKYSMGAGYYLGEDKYSGWIIEKSPIYDRNHKIEEFAYVAGSLDSIYLESNTNITKQETEPSLQFESEHLAFDLVEYSEKAIALFGDTKTIKDLLKSMGGKFNPQLTHNGEKRAGWIFQPSKRAELETIINLKSE